MHAKYLKCSNCGSILETLPWSKDIECLNCNSKDLHNITENAPQWVKGCDECGNKGNCQN